MAGTLFRSMFTNTLTFIKCNTTNVRPLHTASVAYAARKGTRAKARAKKVKVEVTKVGFIPHNQRKKDKYAQTKVSKHINDNYKPLPQDDVYPLKYYRWVVYTAEEAVEAHKQTHHPTMYNVPDALVYAHIDLNMTAAKKTRTMENFTRLSLLPHAFPRDDERTILAFCKGPELVKEAMDAGATIAGGADLIKKIQEGEIRLPEYDYIVAHPNILTELVPIRGLMKRKFPSLKARTLDNNIKETVKKFAGGIQFKVLKDEHQPNFGSVVIPIGRLNMEPKQVAENIATLLKDIQSGRPKRDGLFITKCLITSPPSLEKLKIDPFVYVDKELSSEVQAESDDEGDAVAATA